MPRDGGKKQKGSALAASTSSTSDDQGLRELRAALDGTAATDISSEVPKRWLDVCDGDARAARKRWFEMAEWRRARGADTMLQREQREFMRIKQLFPHFWLGTDVSGNLVSLELMRDSLARVQALRRAGISSERFAAHQIFLTEFWIHHGLAPSGRVVRVIDVRDAPVLSQMFGRVRMYFAPTSEAMAHYPDLTAAIYFVNASPAFRFAWGLLGAFLDKKQRDIIHIVDSADEIPAGILPETYTGGELSAELQHVGLESRVSKHARQVSFRHIVTAEGPDADGDSLRGSRVAGSTVTDTAFSDGDDADESADGPAIARGPEALLKLLPGKWIVNHVESEPMEGVHKMQGLGWAARRAAALLPMSQVIAVSPDRRRLRIVTTAGPVINEAEGPLLHDGEERPRLSQDSESSKEDVFTLEPRPENLAEVCCDTVVRVTFDLPNGDRRSVAHGIHRFSKNKKVMCIEHTSKNGKSARAVLISHRK